MSKSKKEQKKAVQEATPAGDPPGTALGREILDVLDALEPDKVYDVSFTYFRESGRGIHVVKSIQASYRKRL